MTSLMTKASNIRIKQLHKLTFNWMESKWNEKLCMVLLLFVYEVLLPEHLHHSITAPYQRGVVPFFFFPHLAYLHCRIHGRLERLTNVHQNNRLQPLLVVKQMMNNFTWLVSLLRWTPTCLSKRSHLSRKREGGAHPVLNCKPQQSRCDTMLSIGGVNNTTLLAGSLLQIQMKPGIIPWPCHLIKIANFLLRFHFLHHLLPNSIL